MTTTISAPVTPGGGRSLSGFPVDLSIAPTAELLAWCDRVYRQLDRDNPVGNPYGRYEALMAELDARELAGAAVSQGTAMSGATHASASA
ncbi:MAG: hypothetical protein ACHP7K_11295 [Actinomycetales bacterium]|jgi:hypothetical protein